MYIAEKTFRAAKLPDSDTDSGNWVEFQAPRGENTSVALTPGRSFCPVCTWKTTFSTSTCGTVLTSHTLRSCGTLDTIMTIVTTFSA
eukprot:Stramenopile-MAST_4_protein_6944